MARNGAGAISDVGKKRTMGNKGCTDVANEEAAAPVKKSRTRPGCGDAEVAKSATKRSK
jgi:hypothetical protein